MPQTLHELAAPYDEQHRAFVQIMLFRRIMEVGEIIGTFLNICDSLGINVVKPEEWTRRIQRQFLTPFLETVNNELSRLGFHCARIVDEFDPKREWLVFITEHPHSEKLVQASNFSTDELKLIQHWFGYMFSTENEAENNENDQFPNMRGSGEMTATAALNDAKELGLTLHMGQKLLNKLQTNKWIILENDMIRLHPCGIAELESFLQLEHGLDKCQRCNHAILVRRRAFNCPSCDASYHSTCLHKQKFPFKCLAEECDHRILRDALDEFHFDEDEE